MSGERDGEGSLARPGVFPSCLGRCTWRSAEAG